MMPKKFWEIRAAADKKSADLLIYGTISSFEFWGDEVTPKALKAELDGLGKIDALNIYINSPGGNVFAGQAIYNILKRFDAEKVTYVDGLAASIASVIFCVGNRRMIPKNANLMIHQPSMPIYGNATDMRKAADDLDIIAEGMIEVYQNASNLAREEIVAIMDAETWMGAQEALDKGFATEIEDSKEIAACLIGGKAMINGLEMDLSRYKHPPKLAEKPPEPEPKAQEDPDPQGSVFDILSLQNENERSMTK